MKIVRWELTKDQGGYVVEHDGQLKTGPFATQEEAVTWFRQELDVEIEINVVPWEKGVST